MVNTEICRANYYFGLITFLVVTFYSSFTTFAEAPKII